MEKTIVYAKYLEWYNNIKEYVWIGLEQFQPGDMVVVNSSDGVGVVKVTRCEPWTDDSKATEYVIGKVDNEKYEKKMKADELTAELKKKLEARAKELQSIALYEMLAKDDPEMQELVDQYKQVLT